MYNQLISKQRYTISVLLQKEMTISFIAEAIGVSKSTVSREIKRNSTKNGLYDPHLAELSARRRKKEKNVNNRSISKKVRARVFGLIRKNQWSPEQVSGWLLKEEGISVSKSTIYNWIDSCSPHYEDNIRKHLRHQGRKTKRRNKETPILNRTSIDERPIHANGQTIGDWEMDTIVGINGKGAIVTLVDRKSCYMLMQKLDTGKKAKPLARAVISLLKKSRLPVRTITTDNGTEFADHETIAKELGANIYFAHPYSSWEKGAIENMNGLIRQYIPKKKDFKGFSNGWIEHVRDKLNNRPRKKNGFLSPIDMVKEYID